MSKRLGILGGTFNPIHLGHLHIAEFLLEKLDLDRILFIPCAVPPLKEKPLLPVSHRLNMIRLAIRKHPQFKLSLMEIKRMGKSYTIDTLKELSRKHGKNTELFFIIGSDNIGEIPKWKNYKTILKTCTLAAVKRPGSRLCCPQEIPTGVIRMINGPARDISSTEIRNNIAAGKSIRYKVPETVEQYITEKGLYQHA